MQGIKTTTAILMACQTANAISIDRVQQLSVRRGQELYSMQDMIENDQDILPFDEIYDHEYKTVTKVGSDGSFDVVESDFSALENAGFEYTDNPINYRSEDFKSGVLAQENAVSYEQYTETVETGDLDLLPET